MLIAFLMISFSKYKKIFFSDFFFGDFAEEHIFLFIHSTCFFTCCVTHHPSTGGHSDHCSLKGEKIAFLFQSPYLPLFLLSIRSWCNHHLHTSHVQLEYNCTSFETNSDDHLTGKFNMVSFFFSSPNLHFITFFHSHLLTHYPHCAYINTLIMTQHIL